MIRKAIVSLTIFVLLINGSIPPGVRTATAQNPFSLPAVPSADPPGNTKIGSVLRALVQVQSRGITTAFASQRNIKLRGNSVFVTITSAQGQIQAAANATMNAGGELTTGLDYPPLFDAYVPISSLEALANEPCISQIKIPNSGVPTVIGEGVVGINADKWQSSYNSSYNGSGVKIGIIDPGFVGWNASVIAGELPQTLNNTSYRNFASGNEGSINHGTACAEVIYDVAPAAELFFAKFDTETEFAYAVGWLISKNVSIISASIAFPALGAGNGTGTIDQSVDNATAAGILWVAAAGNYATTHWSGNWISNDGDRWMEFPDGLELDSFNVSQGDNISVYLSWNDTWKNSMVDFNLCLFDGNGQQILNHGGTETQNGTGKDPYEQFNLNNAPSGVYHIAIYANNNWTTVNFDLFVVGTSSNLTCRTSAGSVSIPGDSPNALTVGAVFRNSDTTIEPYSSQGPTKDGRTKPDLVGPVGVSTKVMGPSDGVSWQQGGTGFFGTSAATPHVAGAAALVKQRFPNYSVSQISYYLRAKAIDLGDTGLDNTFGNGRLYLPSYTIQSGVQTAGGSITPSGWITVLDQTNQTFLLRLVAVIG